MQLEGMLARQVATQLPASTGAPELLELVVPLLLVEEEVVLVVPLLVVPLDEVVVLVAPLVDEDAVRPELLTPELVMPPELPRPELLPMPPLLEDVPVVLLPLVDPIPEELVAVLVLVAPLLSPDDAPLKSSPGSAAHAATVPAPTLARNTHTRTVERKAVMPMNSWWFPDSRTARLSWIIPLSLRHRCHSRERAAEGQRTASPPPCLLMAQKSPGT